MGVSTNPKVTGILTKDVPVFTYTDDHTLVADNAHSIVQMNKASGNALTVPPNSSVPFPVGTVVAVAQMGAGATTITAGVGVTLNSADSLLTLRAQYSLASLVKVATDTWRVSGDLA